MRVLSALLFLATMPVVVFLATVLYGGISSTVLKQELATSGIYENVVSTITESGEGESASDMEFLSVITERMTPDYIQTKTETLIDDTGSWLGGKTTTPPVLSFKEIKDDITAQNPALLTEIESGYKQFKEEQAQAAQETGESVNQFASSTQGPDQFETFLKSDFTYPVGENLAGLKGTYQTLKIAFPISVILLALSAVGLILFNHTLASRLRWVGVTMILSSIGGFVLIFGNEAVMAGLKSFFIQNNDGIYKVVSPMVTSLLGVFFTKYKEYQTLVSGAFLLIGLGSVVASFVLKGQAVKPATVTLPKSTVAKKKKK